MSSDLNMLQAKCMTKGIGNYTCLRANKLEKGTIRGYSLLWPQTFAGQRFDRQIGDCNLLFKEHIWTTHLRQPQTFAGHMLDIEHLLDCNCGLKS